MTGTLVAIGALLLSAIAVILFLAARKPDTFRIERRARIAAPPERIYPLLADFHAWRDWSPWEGMDPALTRAYEGAPNGPGAAYAWSGNRKVGQGRMEILDATPPSRLDLRIDFLRPFEAHNRIEFRLAPDAAGTDIAWAMHGPQIFIGKVMSLFMDMDRMVGRDFERGLANLKALAEGGSVNRS